MNECLSSIIIHSFIILYSFSILNDNSLIFLYTRYSHLQIRFVDNRVSFSPKAKLWVEGQKLWKIDFLAQCKKIQGEEIVWFRCISLGEFEQGNL